MTLREIIAQRRMEFPEAIRCVFLKSRIPAHEPPALTIKICQWQSRSWVLPWSRFDDACFSAVTERDELVISFSTHRVTAIGANLAGLVDEICRFNVERLRNLPLEYRAKMEAQEPYLQTIDVRSLQLSADAGSADEVALNSAPLRLSRSGDAPPPTASLNRNGIRP